MKIFSLFILGIIALPVFAKNKITYLKMERTACYGKCPTYHVTFLKTGEVIYVGKNNTKMIGTYKSKMSKANMVLFFKKFENYSISGLSNKYTSMSTDLPGMNLTLINNGKTKKINHAESGPRYLIQIAADIDDKVNELKWKDENGKEFKETITDENKYNVENPSVYEYVEQMPEFQGGENAMLQFLSKELKYPTLAIEKGIQGRVLVRFIVDENGKVGNAEVVNSVGYGCDDEALRVVNAMPTWTPGKQNGKNVSVFYNLPVFFKLTK